MRGLYASWMAAWERRLASQDNDRVVYPFEWGWEFTGLREPPASPSDYFIEYSHRNAERSGEFFSYRKPSDYHLENQRLTFTSAVESPYPENNRVWADYFPCTDAGGRAVLVLPQWNADERGHVALCKLLNRCGLAALRLSMAYHARRRPPGVLRADFHVSPNIGRTIQAGRQSVVDARSCLDWLEDRGYHSIGVLGTSLGSCIAYITAAHDCRVRAGAYNHVSMFFGDVVWTGLATRHVRQGLEGWVTQDELREFWRVISPAAYLDRMTHRGAPCLMVWALFDTTFLPEYSRRLLEESRRRGHHLQEARLPCGHYTSGQFPFNLLDAFYLCRFLRSRL